MLNSAISQMNDSLQLLRTCSPKYLARETYAAVQQGNLSYALLICIVLEEKLEEIAATETQDVKYNAVLEVTGKR